MKLTDELRQTWLSYCRGKENFPRDILYVSRNEKIRDRQTVTSFQDLCNKALAWFAKFNTYIGILSHKQRDTHLLDLVWLDLDSDKVQTNVDETKTPLETAFSDVHKIWKNYPNTIVTFSGAGFHCYIPLGEVQLRFPKETLRNFVSKLETGLELSTVDWQSIETNRVMRLVYTVNMKEDRNNLMCILINKGWSLKKILREAQTCSEILQIQWKPEKGLSDVLRKCDNEVFKEILERRKQKINLKSNYVRPCIEKAIHKHLPHKMRLAVAVEHLANRESINQIAQLFRFQSDYSWTKSHYQVEHAQQTGYAPFTCEMIMKLGFCLGEECPIFVPHMVRNPQIVDRFRVKEKVVA